MSRHTLISANFAPQETWADAWEAVRILALRGGKLRGHVASEKVKTFLAQSLFAPSSENMANPHPSISLFLAGRAALKALISTLSLTPGTKIAIVGFTCEAVTLPILSSNLTPVYIDITSEDFSMDLDDLERKYTPEIKALILQHSFGIVPKNREKILEFCNTHDIWVIEDLAHGYTPHTLTKPQSHKWCALFSFGRTKLMSSVFGAGVATLDPTLGEKLLIRENKLTEVSHFFVVRCLLYKALSPIIRSSYRLMGLGKIIHGVFTHLSLFPPELSNREKMSMYDTSYECAYPEALAQTLIPQIQRLDSLIRQVRERGGEYSKALGTLPFASSPLNRFPLVLQNTQTKLRVIQEGRKRHIYIGDWYSQPIAPKEVDIAKMGYIAGSCPTAEEICKRIINLPLRVSAEDTQRVVELITSVTG